MRDSLNLGQIDSFCSVFYHKRHTQQQQKMVKILEQINLLYIMNARPFQKDGTNKNRSVLLSIKMNLLKVKDFQRL